MEASWNRPQRAVAAICKNGRKWLYLRWKHPVILEILAELISIKLKIGTYTLISIINNILRVPSDPSGAFREIQDGVQNSRHFRLLLAISWKQFITS